MLASIENMKRMRDAQRDVFAYSPFTDERYSADSGDYWNAPPGWIMVDAEGNPMILATETTTIVEAE